MKSPHAGLNPALVVVMSIASVRLKNLASGTRFLLALIIGIIRLDLALQAGHITHQSTAWRHKPKALKPLAVG
jgi:hypothetical protein